MKKINKKTIIDRISEKTECHKKDCLAVIDGFFDVVHDFLAEGEKIYIADVMTFEVVDVPEREMKNPRTDKIISVPAKKKIKTRFLPAFIDPLQPGN